MRRVPQEQRDELARAVASRAGAACVCGHDADDHDTGNTRCSHCYSHPNGEHDYPEMDGDCVQYPCDGWFPRELSYAVFSEVPDLLADLEDAESLTAALRLAQARAAESEIELNAMRYVARIGYLAQRDLRMDDAEGERLRIRVVEQMRTQLGITDDDGWQDTGISPVAAERDALAADCDALRAMLAGRCLSDITHRDEEHRQSVCMLPKDHAPLMHDDCMGCTWTDADHWEPSAIDALAEECDGWRHLADVRAARIARVREWIDRRGVNVSDRDDDWMTGYRSAQRHALQNALELRRTLDGEG